jgi:hypothetical protein
MTFKTLTLRRASIATRKAFLANLGKVFPSAKAIMNMIIPEKVPINSFTSEIA